MNCPTVIQVLICLLFCPPASSRCRKNQQYDSKWYIPLTELTFQGPEDTESLTIPQVPDEELDAMKVKISHLRSEIQREKVTWIHSAFQKSVQGGRCFSQSQHVHLLSESQQGFKGHRASEEEAV